MFDWLSSVKIWATEGLPVICVEELNMTKHICPVKIVWVATVALCGCGGLDNTSVSDTAGEARMIQLNDARGASADDQDNALGFIVLLTGVHEIDFPIVEDRGQVVVHLDSPPLGHLDLLDSFPIADCDDVEAYSPTANEHQQRNEGKDPIHAATQ